MSNVLFVLGAADPEMQAIESLLTDLGVPFVQAKTPDGQRVHPGNAYAPEVAAVRYGEDNGETVVFVECAGQVYGVSQTSVVIDHHRPGDPGYGKPPAEFFAASSIGQVVAFLEHAQCWVPGDHEHDEWGQIRLSVDRDAYILVAAADHCLAAAYRGECPGVDPDALMRWRVESRAAHQGRSVDEVLADVERARAVLREAPLIRLGVASEIVEPGWDDQEASEHWYDITCRDMRGVHVPELPEASAREGICFVADGLPRDGRTKVVCQSGTPEQIQAFMEVWAPANGLVDLYGDPARGFAGGYLA